MRPTSASSSESSRTRTWMPPTERPDGATWKPAFFSFVLRLRSSSAEAMRWRNFWVTWIVDHNAATESHPPAWRRNGGPPPMDHQSPRGPQEPGDRAFSGPPDQAGPGSARRRGARPRTGSPRTARSRRVRTRRRPRCHAGASYGRRRTAPSPRPPGHGSRARTCSPSRTRRRRDTQTRYRTRAANRESNVELTTFGGRWCCSRRRTRPAGARCA